ncbi:MAG: TRAP transporter fused permease subunit [Deltaproteobacteria bacterium]|nr:TRAP transporter fused permease subunit [Deltaproteobacteria bacterium]
MQKTKGKFDKCLAHALVVGGVGMFLYHMASSQYMIFGSYEHQDVHLGFALMLIFLRSVMQAKRPLGRFVCLLLLVLSLVCVGYIKLFIDHLEEVIGFPGPLDMVIGIILIILVLEATRASWGWVLPVIAISLVLYFLFGHYIPGALHHRKFSLTYVISYLDIGLSGIFGTFLSISANFVFLFVVFGSLLQLTKLNDLFYEMGKAAGKVLAGGPAQTAVVSSSLVGMVTGAAVANVAITGAYTIPLMKRVGYRPELAGAIEATASTGGQIMPPIMGASAFLMASFLGIPYAEVMLAAIIPAILYYLSVGLGVQLIALKYGIRVPKEKVDWKLISKRLPVFLGPVSLLIILLLLRYSPMYAAFWAILLVLGLGLLHKDTRFSMRELIKAVARGAIGGSQICLALACVGLMAQTLITTGLGIKIVGTVETLSGGHLWIALLFTMCMAIILGCGCPTTAAYSLVAIVVVPALVRSGVLDISAHFFAFYFAIISALTPPVALAALAGAGIAGGNYFKTGVEAFKLAVSGFIIPYMIVYNPVLILRPMDTAYAVTSLVAIPVGLFCLTVVIYNYFLDHLASSERILLTIAAVGLFGYSFTKSFLFAGIGTFLFVYVYIMQRKRVRLKKMAQIADSVAL